MIIEDDGDSTHAYMGLAVLCFGLIFCIAFVILGIFSEPEVADVKASRPDDLELQAQALEDDEHHASDLVSLEPHTPKECRPTKPLFEQAQTIAAPAPPASPRTSLL